MQAGARTVVQGKLLRSRGGSACTLSARHDCVDESGCATEAGRKSPATELALSPSEENSHQREPKARRHPDELWPHLVERD